MVDENLLSLFPLLSILLALLRLVEMYLIVLCLSSLFAFNSFSEKCKLLFFYQLIFKTQQTIITVIVR